MNLHEEIANIENLILEREDTTSPLRRHLLMVIFILLLTFLFDKDLLWLYLFIGIPGVLIITILASVTDKSHRSVIKIDGTISALSFIFFEYTAVLQYAMVDTMANWVFVLRQIVALIFLGITYLTFKNLRIKSEPIV